MNDVIAPFKKSKFNKLYEDDCFQIASGEVRGKSIISVGVRWSVTNLSKGIKYRGFPYMQSKTNRKECWLLVPNDIAIAILMGIKDKNSVTSTVDRDKVYETLLALLEQEK